MCKKITALFLLSVLTCTAAEFRVKPDDGSFERAAKNWKKGDSILLAPGTYYTRFEAGNKTNPPPCGLTIRAEIPGSVRFRGDRPAPVFQPHNRNVWKAQWSSIPETVFEHDTLVHYKYLASPAALQQESGTWTYDAKTKTLFIRTTDSADPAHHALSIGVTPRSGINFYCVPAGPGVQDVLLDGFVTTGYFSRIRYPDQRISSSQHKVAWGVVINHPTRNVKVTNVTAVLNGYGIGFCGGAKDSAIENCRAFGNRNVYDYSGGGIGIFNGADNCIIRGNFGADNHGQDVWLYSGPIKPSTVFAENKGYGVVRTKARKQKGFAVRNCVSESFSHIDQLYYMSNCVAFGYTSLAELLQKTNILLRYEKDFKAEEIFADPVNFDCRVQDGVDANIAKRALTFSSEQVFYWKQNGNDSANGRSVKNAFGSSARVLKELGKPGTEIYLAGPVKGNLSLKGLKNVAIRGRGAFPVTVRGKIILDNCSNVKLERLAPAEFIIQGGSDIQVNQSTGKISADKVDGLRVTHNYIPSFTLKDCKMCFITANVFEKTSVNGMLGWSDYNAYADKVPAGEKNSFTAKAQLGKNFTFKNAWQFDGRAIDSMPVGPYRRQNRNVQLELDKVQMQLLAPDTAVLKLTGNIPFSGSIFWGEPGEKKVHEIKLTTAMNTHAAVLAGLTPGKKYFYQFKVSSSIQRCFSNAELSRKMKSKPLTEKTEFTTSLKCAPPQNYFVAKNGNDANTGSKGNPFGTIGYAVTKLRPGDTLTIRGGTYEENFSVQVSGTKEKPIVIQGMRGERVILQAGYGSPLTGGITVTNQNYIHFKDFVIYGNHSVPDGFAEYAIRTVNCKGLLFKRLLVCGSAHKINAINCEDIYVEDCGFNGGHEGVYFTNCKNQVFRNCTFAHAGLMHLMIRNGESHGKVTIENCIFMDALNMKGRTAVIYVADIATLTERNNCYYNRMPFDQKPLIGWDYNGTELADQISIQGARKFPYCGRRQQPYPAYQKDTNRYNTGSFSANPGLKVFPDYTMKYKSLEDWKQNWEKNEKNRGGEGRNIKENPELLRDLKYFLPTNPEVIKRGCGPRLQ